MIIILNGENKQVDNNTNIDQLLQIIDLSDKRLAVEVNEQIVPRSEFSETTLQESDKVEIVQAIGGGSL
ncbi:Sulfur carrier protein ThiS [hydrothermal vent metagenome]|uniref:Sulfur carrier protein ThiS n=1 Tax=hydrothermal vent metagenome TaxID=652676 RepID=A0A3B0WQP4_9ZZZZ